MDIPENRGTSKSSILIGFAIINHPFWGTPIFGNTHIFTYMNSVDFYGHSCREIYRSSHGWYGK